MNKPTFSHTHSGEAPPGEGAVAPPGPQAPSPHWRMAEHWPDLVHAVTEQSVESVALLLRGLDLLVAKGRISPAEFKVLSVPAERLKRCGMNAQQIVRFQSGQVRQSHEKTDIAYLLECVLQESRGQLTLMGITLRRKLKPVDVLIDPALGFSLAQAMLEWCTPFGSRIDLRLDVVEDPPRARLWMKTQTDVMPDEKAVQQDSLQWLLLKQLAATDGGIEVRRSAAVDGVELMALFRRTVVRPPEEVAKQAADADGDTDTTDSSFKSVSGAHVLVASHDSDLRHTTLNILRLLGVTTSNVANLDQARAVMARQHVHLLVIDRSVLQPDIEQLLVELRKLRSDMPVIEIGPAGSGAGAGSTAGATQRPDGAPVVVARNEIQASLGSAVMFALSRVV